MEITELLKEGKRLEELKIKVTFYARVSTDHEEQLSSITNQINYFIQYINNNPNWKLHKGYIDEGISGKNAMNRKNFLKMIEDAKNHKFNLILSKSVSRFARNTIDSIKYTNILLKEGIGVLFINDNINTFYSDSEFRLTLMASIAQDEIRKLSESVRFGLQESIKRGIVLGNNNLLGYQKNKGKLIIIEAEAKIVRDIFLLFKTKKYNYKTLSQIINTKYQLNYDSTRIKRILKNYKYKGYYCGRKSKVIDYKNSKRKKIEEKNWIIYKDNITIPPIIEESIWNKVNEIIKKRKKTIPKELQVYKDIAYCNIHQKKLKLKYKEYKNKYYSYLICPNCIRISTNLLDRIYRINPFYKVIIKK